MKFRKILTTALALCCITACNSRPDGISDDMYNYAESAIKAADAYMDNQLSFNEAYQKLDGLRDNAYKLSQSSESGASDTSVMLGISFVKQELNAEHSGSGTYAELLKERNTLAQKIGYSERD